MQLAGGTGHKGCDEEKKSKTIGSLAGLAAQLFFDELRKLFF